VEVKKMKVVVKGVEVPDEASLVFSKRERKWSRTEEFIHSFDSE